MLSLGFFGRFGRSPALRAFDAALRSVDLHPNLVPEAVKLTAVKMLMEQAGGGELDREATRDAAALVVYCMTGGETFAHANGTRAAEEVERRIDVALDQGTSLDARLVLLTVHAKVIQPSVVDQFGLEVTPG